jgi:hypothetical protein
MRTVELPELSDLDGVDATKLEVLLTIADRAQCQVEAMLAEIANACQSTRAFRADGHSSVKGWLMANRSWSGEHAARTIRAGKLLRDLDDVRVAFHNATVGVDQVNALAHARANPRCGHTLKDVERPMLQLARHMPLADLQAEVAKWVSLADEEGAHKDWDRAEKGRGVRTGTLAGLFTLLADGPALAGADMVEILDKFAEAEFKDDWDALVAKVGEANATVAGLDRTHQQRRWDALHKVFLTAAGAPPDTVGPIRLADVVIDHVTFERTLAQLFGVELPPDDPTRFQTAHCRTIDGVLVDPHHAVFAALLGEVRRVLWTAPGIPTELGTKRRLFSGSLRTVIQLLASHCVDPGCTVPTSRCQIDHLEPSAAGGPTASHNGGPKCARGNRWAWRSGYRTRRDAEGFWHMYRPDGTEIGPTDWWDSS